jgi:hypothetical protein
MLRLGRLTWILFLTALPAVGHPTYVPVDPPAAWVQSDPGRTTFTLTRGNSGWSMTLARSVTEACDVVAVLTPESLFDLRLRARLFPTLFPLRMAVEVGLRRLEVLGALHLGPVRLVGSRCWGEEGRVRVAAYVSKPGLVAAAGAIAEGEHDPFVALSWLPEATPLWSVTLSLTSRGPQVAIGGTW